MSIFESLTERQHEVYDFIRDKIRGRGYGPTVREIGLRFKISSPNGVVCHLKALEKKGLITREPNMSRAIQLSRERLTILPPRRAAAGPNMSQAIQLSREPAEERGLPLSGRVAAGVLHEAIEQTERIDFGDMFNKKNQFVLEVQGDSMIEAHINDGDYVVVKRQKTAASGQMVVARTEEGESTLKYWFPERSRIRLQPANSGMQPIYVKNAEVLGVVVGVVRKME